MRYLHAIILFTIISFTSLSAQWDTIKIETQYTLTDIDFLNDI